jgi:hypothetical protein
MGLLQCSRNSPHVSTCIDIPLGIVSFALRTETRVSIANVGVVGTFVARLAVIVSMAMDINNIQSAFQIFANFVHLGVYFAEKRRHAAGGGGWLRLGR